MKRNLSRRILKLITNLRFSIGLLLFIAFVTIIGTVIEQEKAIDFYQENYPLDSPVLGFVSWKVIILLGLDHLYSNIWFYSLLLLFSCSLLACTFSTQLPLLKVARTWKFLTQKRQFTRLSLNLNPQKLLNYSNCVLSLNKKGYFVFHQKKHLYAYKGLIGRVSPIFVHFSLILILFGAIVSSFSGFVVQEIVPQGEYFHIQNLVSAGNLSFISQELIGKVENFRISYNKDGSINQFFSTLSLQDLNGYLVKQDTIYVNKPLKYKDISIYQTDWNITGIKLCVNNKFLQLSAVPSILANQRTIWIAPFATGISPRNHYLFVIKDLKGEIDIYTQESVFLSTQKIGITFSLDNLDLMFSDVFSSTGLQIKSDPGIPIVYFGFFFLMLSSFLSYLTYSQIWFTSSMHSTIFGGSSNRDIVNFEEEFYLMSNNFYTEDKSL
nr:Ccs1 [Porphyrostromium boryanum]